MSRRRKPLAPVIEEEEEEQEEGVPTPARQDGEQDSRTQAILQAVARLDAEVEERINAIRARAEEAYRDLMRVKAVQAMKLPKQVRDLPFDQLKTKFPAHYDTVALSELRARHAALAFQLAPAPPATACGRGATARKRGAALATPAGPRTVLAPRTVRARTLRGGAAAECDSEQENVGLGRSNENGLSLSGRTTRLQQQAAKSGAPPSQSSAQPSTFRGRALATPMPFAGAAEELPVTFLRAARPGSRTAASRGAPDALLVNTKDGQTFAVDLARPGGLEAVPETHRPEVAGYLGSVMDRLLGALGRAVGGKQRVERV